jgi:hypothetical protein
MPDESSHADAEQRFRALVAEAGLPAPDDVEREAQSLIFYWHGPRVAVVVELDGRQPRAVGAVSARSARRSGPHGSCRSS